MLQSNVVFFLVAMGISAVLYVVMAAYKRYSYLWWAVGGIAVCIPIVIVIPFVEKKWLHHLQLSQTTIFIAIYLIIYLMIWLFSKRSELSEGERTRREKINEIIFDGFFAIKEKRITEAYNIFRRGQLIDPDNPVIKTILSSFHQGAQGLVKKSLLFEWRYKVLYFFRRKKKPKTQVLSKADTGENSSGEKKVEGRVIK